jgi:hypothetical protein
MKKIKIEPPTSEIKQIKLKNWDNCHHTEPDRKIYQYLDGTKYEVCSICGISRKID